MPIYLYKREDEGGHVEHFVQCPDDRPDTITCEDGVKAHYDFAASMGGGMAGLEEKLWPMESSAAGVHPNQVAPDGRYRNPEARKRHPHHRFNPNTGDMVFKSMKHRRTQLNDIGMRDLNSYY